MFKLQYDLRLDGVDEVAEKILIGVILCCCAIGCSIGSVCRTVYDRCRTNRREEPDNHNEAELVALQNNIPNNNVPNNDNNNEEHIPILLGEVPEASNHAD